MKRKLPGQEEYGKIRNRRAQTNAEMECHLALITLTKQKWTSNTQYCGEQGRLALLHQWQELTSINCPPERQSGTIHEQKMHMPFSQQFQF